MIDALSVRALLPRRAAMTSKRARPPDSAPADGPYAAPDAAAATDNAYKRAEKFYKLYKDGRSPPSLADVIDVDRPGGHGVETVVPGGAAPAWLAAARVFALRGVDGFRLIRGALSVEQQLELAETVLCEWLEPPVVTNLDLHHGPCERLWRRHLREPAGSLFAKLSWATLGRQYRWTERRYDAKQTAGERDTFPPRLARLCSELAAAAGERVAPEAAIVNFYARDSLMGGHLDDAEHYQGAPIVSVSVGLDAIYLLGGPTRATPPRALRLRSGDVVVQGGASRGYYHGVPRVCAGTSPPDLEAAAATPGQRDVAAWLREHRMNINVRQVYPPAAAAGDEEDAAPRAGPGEADGETGASRAEMPNGVT